ncbi:MAG: hypothetical protein IJL54_00780 [Prevotella sp.]|nr:hypothetical protein [Prevotella sp.]
MIRVKCFLALFLINPIAGNAQDVFSEAKDKFYAIVDSCERNLLYEEDDLSFLLQPLDQLKLDRHYMLSDFRISFYKAIHSRVKDESSLRLYVRKKSVKRPHDDYIEEEFLKYRRCSREGKDYKEVQGSIPFTSPFERIKLSGSDMSFWHIYLLDASKRMFGMRNEANYNKEYLVTCPADVDKALSLVKKWEGGEKFYQNIKGDTMEVRKARHMKEVQVLVDSLNNLKGRSLAPIITHRADTVYIEHYSFMEFAGLIRRKIAIYHDGKKRKVYGINDFAGEGSNGFDTIARYRHQVWF